MNYNYGGPVQQLDRNPYAQFLQEQDPQRGEFLRQWWQAEPDRAYEYWMRSMNLSNSQERALRAAYSSIYNNFEAMRDVKSPGPTVYKWVDYLNDFNVNKELARLSPEARYENASRFSGPARWVSF